MKKVLSLDIKYASSQIFYFAAFCSMIGYVSVYLLDKNFTNSTIGIVLALSNLIAVFAQPILASFVDKHKNIELRQILSMIILVVLILSVILYVFPVQGTIILIILVTLFSIMNTIMPLMNSLAFVFEKYGIQINYGLARGIGSVAYALASTLLGYVVEMYSPSILPLFYVIFNALLFIVVRLFVLPKSERNVVEVKEIKEDNKEEVEQLSFGKFCLKYKKFILFLGGFVLVYFAHMFINSFFIQIITPIGGDTSSMGLAISIAALLELPTMAAFEKLNKKINCGTLIKISIVMFTVKHVLTYFAVNMMMIYVAQAMQMFAYALFIPASVYYVNAKIAESDRVKGQSLVTMAMTFSGVLSSLICGALLDMMGESNVLLLGAILSVVGTVVVYFTAEKV